MSENPKYIGPEYVRENIFNGVNGPKLNNNGVYALFQRKDSPAFKIGKKWFAPTEPFLEWLNKQALNKEG
ncbi:MAG TPA: hypothetical protein DDW50_04395 [Firmicutes bacterium]|jgi:hypothetical protein|nr:hypothetical protein [Bacillota bacterium]